MYGCILSPYDERDYKAKDFVAKGIRPDSYMPAKLAPVLHQGAVGKCVACALATMKWYHEQKERQSEVEWSTDYIYHNRLVTDHQGEGMIVREALSQLKKYGVCPNDLLPSNKEYPNEYVRGKLSGLADAALPQRIDAYVRCEDEDDICDCAAQNGAALVVVEVKSSFKAFWFKDETNWVLPMPNSGEKSFGFHAICVIGYNEQGIIIQNSWGENWGKEGLAVLPYGYPLPEAWSVVDLVEKWDLIELVIGEKKARLNGKEIVLDVPAQIIDDRAMVPLRFIAESLGCNVEWFNDEQRIIVRKEAK